MATVGQQFPFLVRATEHGAGSLAPMLPVTLVGARSVSVLGLLDTGAAVNVLPYNVGANLGLSWEQQTTSVQLSGNMAVAEARAVLVSAAVAGFAPVRLRSPGQEWTTCL